MFPCTTNLGSLEDNAIMGEGGRHLASEEEEEEEEEEYDEYSNCQAALILEQFPRVCGTTATLPRQLPPCTSDIVAALETRK